jgi:Mn2+ and Fe2+ transporters of the NRAMP family
MFNIGAGLGCMADALQMVAGIPFYLGTPFFAFLIIGLLFWTSYRTIARVFKGMTLALFAYVIAAFLARPNWLQVMRATLIPHVEWTRSYVSVLVGILGTTISPYLFFWQTAQEVEEDRERGKVTVAQRRDSTDEELAAATRDAVTGMLFSNLVMYFIILTTAATLNAHGMKQISTAHRAAEALRPLAGQAHIGCLLWAWLAQDCWAFQCQRAPAPTQ